MAKWYWEKQLDLTDFKWPANGSWSTLQDSGFFYGIDSFYGASGGTGISVYTKDTTIPYQNYNVSGWTSTTNHVFGQPGSYTGNFYTAWNDTTPGELKSYLYVKSLSGTLLGSIALGVYNSYPIAAIVEISPTHMVIIRDGVVPYADFKAEVREIPVGFSSVPFSAGVTITDAADPYFGYPKHMKYYMDQLYFQTTNRTYLCSVGGSITDIGISTIVQGNIINESFSTTYPYSWTLSSVVNGVNEWGYNTERKTIKTVDDAISIDVNTLDVKVVIDGYDINNNNPYFGLNFTTNAPDLHNTLGEFLYYNGDNYTIANPIRDWDYSRCSLADNIAAVGLGNLHVHKCWRNGADIYAISRDWTGGSTDFILWKLKWSIGTASVGKSITRGYKQRGKVGRS